MVAVFRELRRVLHPSGTLWLNVADSYTSGETGRKDGGHSADGRPNPGVRSLAESQPPRKARRADRRTGLPPKNLVMVPARLALALQADGWCLRAEVSLNKVAPMPESVRDRVTRASERLYLLAKGPRYFYDQEAEREPNAPASADRYGFGGDKDGEAVAAGLRTRVVGEREQGDGRNLWDWWDCPLTEEETASCDDIPEPSWEWVPEPSRIKHFAIMPSFLARRCVRLGTSAHGVCSACNAPWVRVVERERPVAGVDVPHGGRELDVGGHVHGNGANSALRINGPAYEKWQREHGGASTLGWQPSCRCQDPSPRPALVLDPFAGAGTTLLVARLLGRRALGVELSPEYAALARKRVGQAMPLFDGTEGADA
jgi:hypothetical protein